MPGVAVIFTPTVILQLQIAFAILECLAAHGAFLVILTNCMQMFCLYDMVLASDFSLDVYTTDGKGMFDLPNENLVFQAIFVAYAFSFFSAAFVSALFAVVTFHNTVFT